MVETAFSFADLLAGKARVTQENKGSCGRHGSTKTVERRQMQSPIMRRIAASPSGFLRLLLETLQKGGRTCGRTRSGNFARLPAGSVPCRGRTVRPGTGTHAAVTAALLYELQHFTGRQGPCPRPSCWKPGQADLHRQGGTWQRSVNMRISAANNYFRRCGRHDLLMHHSRPNAVPVPELTRAEYLRLLPDEPRGQNKHRLYLLIKLFATHRSVAAVPGADHRGRWCRTAAPVLDCRGSPLEFPSAGGAAPGTAGLYRRARPGIRPGVHHPAAGGPSTAPTCAGRCRNSAALPAMPEQKGQPPLHCATLYQATQNDIYANLEQMLQQAYDQLLQAEQTAAGWKEGGVDGVASTE